MPNIPIVPVCAHALDRLRQAGKAKLDGRTEDYLLFLEAAQGHMTWCSFGKFDLPDPEKLHDSLEQIADVFSRGEDIPPAQVASITIIMPFGTAPHNPFSRN